jgi:glucose-6-phosphate 1-dehydrogenase
MENKTRGGNREFEALVRGVAEDLGLPDDECIEDVAVEPCTLVIIGASGDLTTRKLIPSLFNLYLNNGLPSPFVILGCSRTKMDDDGFRNRIEKALSEGGSIDREKWKRFAKSLFYRCIEYDDPSSYVNLAKSLQSLDREHGTKGNRIFYLSIPPTLYEMTAQMLGKADLSAQKKDGGGWARIVVEKPFGQDLETAIALDRTIHEYFQESQIFRIDHYLAKETVQNILIFRFANAIFEPLWNRWYIDHVSITAAESLGLEQRAGYYEQAGVLRDMFQNHMMQLLALTAMEPPSRFEADLVRDEKTKLYRALRPFPVEKSEDYIVLGQYDRGTIGGKAVPAYREEPGVNPESLVPTFAVLKVYVDNWRWQGVPFYMTSGKRLERKVTEITIQFKEVPHSMFRQVLGEEISPNRLILGIYPEEKISLVFETKYPGARVCLRSVTMDFNYQQGYKGPALDAYEKVLLDVMLGDHTLFWREDGVEICWSFLTPILQECETCINRSDMLRLYPAGSWGPEAAKKLLQHRG